MQDKFSVEQKIKLLKSELGEERIKTDIKISEYLITKLGGVSSGFYIATTIRELIKSIILCRQLKLKIFLIGSGSKVAIKEGFLGIVIKNRSDNIKISGIKGKVSKNGIGIEEAFIEADSGVSLNSLADFAKKQKLTGFESLQNNLGTIGGSLKLNLTLQQKLHQIEVLSEDDKIVERNLNNLLEEDIILTIIFKLKSVN